MVFIINICSYQNYIASSPLKHLISILLYQQKNTSSLPYPTTSANPPLNNNQNNSKTKGNHTPKRNLREVNWPSSWNSTGCHTSRANKTYLTIFLRHARRYPNIIAASIILNMLVRRISYRSWSKLYLGCRSRRCSW